MTVTTPGGTSQTAAGDSNSFVPTFTYAPMAPTVTGLVGTIAGSITGNTMVTIQGTGLWNAPNNPFPAQVFFCPTGGQHRSRIASARVGSRMRGAGCDDAKLCGEYHGAGSAGIVHLHHDSADASGECRWHVLPPGRGVQRLQRPDKRCVHLFRAGAAHRLVEPTQWRLRHRVDHHRRCQLFNRFDGGILCRNKRECHQRSMPDEHRTGQTKATTTSPKLTTTQIVVTVPTTLAAGTYYPIVGLPPYAGADQRDPYNEPADEFVYS